MDSQPLADKLKGNLFGSIDKAQSEVSAFANKDQLSEIDMMKFNMSVSRYNMFTTLTTNIVKQLTDGEKAIAQKM